MPMMMTRNEIDSLEQHMARLGLQPVAQAFDGRAHLASPIWQPAQGSSFSGFLSIGSDIVVGVISNIIIAPT